MIRSHSPQAADRAILVDPFGRRIDYVRISITDRCDLRCVYCMPERQQFLPRAQLLTLEEIARLGRCFSELGVSRLRITGGEPLMRRNALCLFERLGALPGVNDLTLTTNASQLARYAPALVRAGVRRVNISLDTLRPARFRALTRRGELAPTLAGIEAALAAGFRRVSLNSVILRGRNDDEVCNLVAFAIERGLDIRFIEEMPLGAITEHDRAALHYPSEAIRADLARHHELIPSTAHEGGPARYFIIPGTATRVGFISPHSHNFCADCNRVRVTTEGRLLLCLGQEHSVDLRRVLRAHPDDDQPVRHAIVAAMALKPRGHDFSLVAPPRIRRHMNHTGG
ncbi:GTP 3',8-cyclase MoaA [Marichromatium gracile]|uniref:GTP 3',8-cyclase MoaA n=1 Tax=Marichromatium gracile TaxID=1048 RepID=UPI001F3843D0|nr:GTP 3',8-cyclase MoaA [Marichromatium gracile]MCF1182686.1 GTP 3',8-cyclase MoaA [Marichromatium gracile]